MFELANHEAHARATEPAVLNGASAEWRPWALIAAKSFARAKSRLGSALPAHERRALASTMFDHVLDACTRCSQLQGTLVATDGDDVAEHARRRNAAVLRDEAAGSLAAVIDAGLSLLRAGEATHVLVMMADLPLLKPCDVSELLACLRKHDLVITPDVQRRGTSALGVRLDLDFQSCFGHDDSLQRHLQQAARISARSAVRYNPRIAFDVDTPEDLVKWELQAQR